MQLFFCWWCWFFFCTSSFSNHSLCHNAVLTYLCPTCQGNVHCTRSMWSVHVCMYLLDICSVTLVIDTMLCLLQSLYIFQFSHTERMGGLYKKRFKCFNTRWCTQWGLFNYPLSHSQACKFTFCSMSQMNLEYFAIDSQVIGLLNLSRLLVQINTYSCITADELKHIYSLRPKI